MALTLRSNGSPVNLVGSTFTMTVVSPNATSSPPVATLTASIVDAPAGQIQIGWTAEQIAGLVTGSHAYRLLRTVAGVTTEILYGPFTMTTS
jgi:hypothetical protein